MSDDTPDPGLLPVPWHVEGYVALLQNPARASLVLGLPFAAIAYGISVFGVLPASGIVPPTVDAVMGWFAGSLLAYIRLTRPY